MGIFLACDNIQEGGNRCKNTTVAVALVARDGKPELDWLITPTAITCPNCQEAEQEPDH